MSTEYKQQGTQTMRTPAVMIISRIAVVLPSRAKPCQCGLRCKCSICILMSPGLLPVRDEKFILLRHFSTFL